MEERRESLRIDERIPLTVSNRSAGWTEETETENLSTNGCLFSLRKEVEVGDQLELSTEAGPSASIDSRVVRFVPQQGLVGVSVEPDSKWLALYVFLTTSSKPEVERNA